MTDPQGPDDTVSPWQNTGAVEPPTTGYPPYTDPAYAGQLPMYPPGYPPQPPLPNPTPNPTLSLPRQPWDAGPPPAQPPVPPPSDVTPGGDGGGGRPPRRFPTWLWLLTGVAVLLVVGLMIALALSNDSAQRSATAPPITPLPTASGTPTPRPTTTTPAPSTSPPGSSSTSPSTTSPSTGSPSPGIPETVVYRITGTGKALSVAYIDTEGILQTEFNVTLPWTKQVTLTPPSSRVASVTVVNIGAQVGCSVTVDGTQVSQRTGAFFLVCTAVG